MAKLDLTEMVKEAAILTVTGAMGVDGLLASAEVFGLLDIPARWYLGAPLLGVSAIFLGTALRAGDRIWDKIEPRRIVGFSEPGPRPQLRSIPFAHFGGRTGQIMANTVRTIWDDGPAMLPAQVETHHSMVWKVPAGENWYTIRESELLAFLEVAVSRDKYQFSRRYWTERRRPPMYRPRYEAIMKLLGSANLIDGRGGRASGVLKTTPRHALTYLKYESQYAG